MAEETFSSFAKTLATLQKLTKIEAGISKIVASSKIPHSETRKFLRCEMTEQGSNTALFQFLEKVMSDVELGDIELVELEQFKHVFQIKENPVAALYPEIENRKTCYVTADALSQFYSKDMSLVNTCEEVECINGGSDHCVFEINLQPLSVYQVVLDRSDRKMVEVMSKMESPGVEQMADELLLEPEEVEYRLDILRRYHLCTDDNKLTKIGMTYSKYGTGPLSEKEEEFSPPWDDLSAVAASVAGAGSFAEAFKETAEAEPIWEVDEKQIINLAEEAKKSKSFAELLSRHLNKDDEEGGN